MRMINHLPQQKNHKTTNWQTQLANTITNIDELLQLLELPHLTQHTYTPDKFKLRVPLSFVKKMQIGDANDPLLKQVLTNVQALQPVQGYQTDPLEENTQQPLPGLLHKYKSRILVTLTGACAIHCRYCFRQHFDYVSNTPKPNQIDAVVNYVQQQPNVTEVILSGGDPLSLNNRRLFDWLDKLSAIKQITNIRLHTRMPVVIPERIDNELLSGLANYLNAGCKLIIVIHCNHANEIDDNTAIHLSRLQQIGVTLLNQSVLLAGVNDDIGALTRLSNRLFEANVLPYYLHLLDKVDGSAYFEVSEKQAITLYWQLLAELPGFLVPKLVKELPNKAFKTPINVYKYNTPINQFSS